MSSARRQSRLAQVVAASHLAWSEVTSQKSTRGVDYVDTMTPTVLPLDEDDVDARVASGELVLLTIDGTVPVRPEVLAQLRERAKQGAKERRGPQGPTET